jgi:hypothetical protein
MNVSFGLTSLLVLKVFKTSTAFQPKVIIM